MNWKKMPISHKIAGIISCLAVVLWLIHLIKPSLFPIDVSCPAVAVFTVCEAVVNWNDRRKFAYVMIAAAVISIAFFMLEIML